MGNFCDTLSNEDTEVNCNRFYLKNVYDPSGGSSGFLSVKEILDPENQTESYFNNLFAYIQELSKNYFEDPNFTEFEESNKNKIKLSEIFNYERQKIDYVYTAFETRLDSFEQKDL